MAAEGDHGGLELSEMFGTIAEALRQALDLILSGDPEVISITALSIYTSGSATLLSCAWGLPIAALLGLSRFPGRGIIKGLFNAMLGFPTVVLGLILYLLLSRSGPLGGLQLLYTPSGIILGQSILISPIIISFAGSALESVDAELRDLARTLGASGPRTAFAILREASGGIALAILASFNRAISELGIALMIGGNIRHATRVLTTAISLETARGEIALSIALGIILMAVVLSVTFAMELFRRL
jgi:tungstate transport system permease protein